MKSEVFVSVVLNVDNQSDKLVKFLNDLCPYLFDRYSDYEILVVDQASRDNIEKELDALLNKYISIRHLRLTYKVDEDVAFAAGLENAIGDFVINLNLDYDKVEVIDKLISAGRNGSDIVICTSEKISSKLYKYSRRFFGNLIKSIGYTLPSNSTGSFCLSRRAVNAVTETGRYYSKLYIKMANTGYNMTDISCDEYISEIKCKKNLLRGMRETLHYMIFNSTKPLRWMSTLGILGSFATMVFSIYSLIVNMIKDQVAPGWTTMILFMSFLFMLLFIMLSFFGEYLARLLDDSSEHKDYSVVYERSSSVMLDENRVNIYSSSESGEINLSQSGRNK